MEVDTFKKESGFTLVEILVVITLIALVASLVAPKLFSKLGSSQVKTARIQIGMLETALDAFRLDVGRYPSAEENLKVLWEKPESLKRWDGPYLPKPVREDPWGNPYIYTVNGKDDTSHLFELLSYGPDGKINQSGGDDISVWD